MLLVTDTGSYAGLNHWDLVNIFNSYGCQYAYNLDGGSSSVMVYRGREITSPTTLSQNEEGRYLPDAFLVK